ncbi:MAG: hypothetical protein ACLT69_08420 [Intestinibacter bartlettii]
MITQIQNLRYIGKKKIIISLKKMCDDLITKYFGDTINYPLDMLTLETEEKVEPNQKNFGNIITMIDF